MLVYKNGNKNALNIFCEKFKIKKEDLIPSDNILIFSEAMQMIGKIDLHKKIHENWKRINKAKSPTEALLGILNKNESGFTYQLESNSVIIEDDFKTNPNITPQCPECSGKSYTSKRVSSRYVKEDPWSKVLEVFKCNSCELEVPAHIWQCWSGLTLQQAKTEWLSDYRKRSINKLRVKILDSLGDSSPKCDVEVLLKYLKLSNEIKEFQDALNSIECFYEDLTADGQKKVRNALEIMLLEEMVTAKQLSSALIEILNVARLK